MKLETALELAISAKKAGKQNTEIKSALEQQGLSKEEASAIVKEADHQYLGEMLETAPSQPLFEISQTTIGYVLIALGVLVTVVSYLQIIDFHGYYILFYGPILAGIGMIAIEKRQKFKAREKEITFKSKFKRNF